MLPVPHLHSVKRKWQYTPSVLHGFHCIVLFGWLRKNEVMPHGFGSAKTKSQNISPKQLTYTQQFEICIVWVFVLSCAVLWSRSAPSHSWHYRPMSCLRWEMSKGRRENESRSEVEQYENKEMGEWCIINCATENKKKKNEQIFSSQWVEKLRW